jgi:hypothetical protein
MASHLRNRVAIATLLGAAFLTAPDLSLGGAEAAENVIPLTDADRSNVELTVYPDSVAMISEQRKGELVEGLQVLRIEDLPSSLIDQSLVLGADPKAGLKLVATRDARRPTDSRSLLRHFIGQQVKLRQSDMLVDATVLAVDNQILVRTEDGVQYVNPGDIVLTAVPDDLIAPPALEATVKTGQPTDHVSMAYLIGGVSWQTAYVGRYDSKTDTLALSARARIVNQSGGDIHDGQLRLVAGNPNQVSNGPRPMPMAKARTEMLMSAAADSGAQPDRNKVENLHLYGPYPGLEMKDGDVVTLPLLDTRDLKADRDVIFNGNTSAYYGGRGYSEEFVRPQMRLTIKNDGGKDGRSPWPNGIIRIYSNGDAKDGGQPATFLGEDQINLTPAGQEAHLTLGLASDISGTRKVVSYDRKSRPNMSDAITASLEWTIQNSGPRDETVTINENVPADWQITEESQKHEDIQAGQLRWKIKVPAGGKTTLKWTVKSNT